ncbi:MAG: ester cyclase [Micromonosporaceae bacterium]
MLKEELAKVDEEGTAAWNRHDVDTILGQLADDFVWRDTSLPGPLNRKEEVRDDVSSWFNAFPDMEVTVTDRVIGEDKVAGEVEFTGTNTGPLKVGETEIPATGKRVTGKGAYLSHVENGKITEFSMHPDVAGLMMQMGLMSR